MASHLRTKPCAAAAALATHVPDTTQPPSVHHLCFRPPSILSTSSTPLDGDRCGSKRAAPPPRLPLSALTHCLLHPCAYVWATPGAQTPWIAVIQLPPHSRVYTFALLTPGTVALRTPRGPAPATPQLLPGSVSWGRPRPALCSTLRSAEQPPPVPAPGHTIAAHVHAPLLLCGMPAFARSWLAVSWSSDSPP